MDSRGDLALGVDRSVFGNGLLLTVRADFACKAPTRTGRAMSECGKGRASSASSRGRSWFCRICASLQVFACSQRAC